MRREVISGISPGFPELSQSQRQVAHVLLTRSPLTPPPKRQDPLDLHVLSTPPAFVLSQDQTLQQSIKRYFQDNPNPQNPTPLNTECRNPTHPTKSQAKPNKTWHQNLEQARC